MPANSTRRRPLPPPIAALDATVECLVQTKGYRRGTFHALLATALNAHATTMTYSGTTFAIEYNENRGLQRVFTATNLGQPMPDIFKSNGFRLSAVRIHCHVPQAIRPKPGRYIGFEHGYKSCQCWVDPTGEFSGTPAIYALGNHGTDLTNSELYGETLRLFIDVMLGKLSPDDH